MKIMRLAVCTLVGIVGLHSQITSSAKAEISDGTRFHFDLGLTYVDGAYDVNKQLKASLVDNGYTIQRDYVVPVGLSLNPRVQFGNGLGVGLSLGPTSFIGIERNGGFNVGQDLSYIIPVGGFVQYNFFRHHNVSPYLRGGVKYPITGGDFIKSGTIGGYGAVGVQFFNQKRVGVGLEVGYDSSRVTISAGPLDRVARKATPTGLNASLVIFF